MGKNGTIVVVVTIALAVVIIIAAYLIIQQKSAGQRVVLETNMGNMVIELYRDMPKTTENFKGLVNEGFYDGILFHRVIDGFVIQGGDPLTKDPSKKNLWGTGGSEQIKDEFGSEGNKKYSVAMANAGPNTGSSQFFINLQDNLLLDGRHPVFGEVVEGKEIVDAIAKVETDKNDAPIEEVKIQRAYLLD